jgi:hypothetical protein
MLQLVSDLVSEIRSACAEVAGRAQFVTVMPEAIPPYAAGLPSRTVAAGSSHSAGDREERAAFWITLDAVNFGSGWFPTLRKRRGRSGYFTVVAGIRDRFGQRGAWSAAELAQLEAAEIADQLGQDRGHELMQLFATSLRDVGERVQSDYGGSFAAVVDAAGSAVAMAALLGGWRSFADRWPYHELEVPLYKRAQIAAADLHRAGVSRFADIDRLTMFADNLVPHVLRLDGVLGFAPKLVERINRQELIQAGSPEEIEIRACAVHAVELIVAAGDGRYPAEVDEVLWNRGQEPRYKAAPRHRCRSKAY